jgi:hypothetical protein
VAFASLVAALASCTADAFDPSSHVDTLRVLAVRTDVPFARPGEHVKLEALVADPGGGGRPVRLAWGTCLNPGSAEIPACADEVSGFSIGGPTFDVDVPANAEGAFGVVFAACAGSFVDGHRATAPIGCVDARGDAIGREGFMWGAKRVVVSADARNQNPQIAGLSVDGAPWTDGAALDVPACDGDDVADCAADRKRRLAITAAPGSAETYGGSTEDLVAFFFVSQGQIDADFVRVKDGAFAVTFAAIHADAKKPVLVWVVLRDDRGGVDWVTRAWTVR